MRFAAGIAGVLAAAGVLLYMARRPAASWLAERYLADRGIESSIVFESLDFGGAVAQVRLGPSAAPDLTVQKLTVAFGWHDFSPHLESADLFAPMLRIRYNGRSLSLGALEGLMGSAPEQPAASNGIPYATHVAHATTAKDSGPAITAEDAQLFIETPAGPLRLTGFAKFAEGRVRTLYASASPATFKTRKANAELGSAVLSQDANGRIVATMSGGFAAVNNGRHVAANGLAVRLAVTGLNWSSENDGSLRIAAQIDGRFDADELDAEGASLTAFATHLAAAGTFDTRGNADVSASLTANGVMPEEKADTLAAAVPLLGSDPAGRTALAKALRRPNLNATGVHILRSAGQTYVTLAEPVEVSGEDAKLSLSVPRGSLAYAAAGVVRGMGELNFSGMHLPSITVSVPSYIWQNTADGGDDFEGRAEIKAALDFKTVRGAALTAKGGMKWHNRVFAFVPDGCADIRIAALVQKGRRIARDARAQLCGRPGGDFLSVQQKSWSVNTAWQALSLRLTGASAKLASRGGTVMLAQQNGTLSGSVDIADARLSDLSRTRRFQPVAAAGRMTITDDVLRGRIALSGSKQTRLAGIAIIDDIRSGRGHAEIHADAISFAPDHAQPGDLSPLLAPLAKAEGKAGFTGRIAWTPRGTTSSGELRIENLDFMSPLGKVHGAHGQVRFTSLVPLHTQPDQEIAVAKVDWATPLTELSAKFEASPAVLTLHGAEGSLAEGHISLGPLSYSLSPGATTAGEIVVHDIDAGALVNASNLAGKIELSARVSGTVPFRYGPEGLRFTEGRIAIVGPGKLSIARSLWSNAETNAGSGAIRDFAYQALEHLAIEEMDGRVNSLPGGRLGIVFHIKGRHEPETPKPAEVGVFALLRGKALDKPIPLPKGTEVNLTLDTSLNFDELLTAYRRAWADSLAKTPAEAQADRGRSSK